ncbi:SurA N-terminal domain-containing protein [Sporosarcina sp. JAI121]|uniref:SurA N-terminal domain-containing protein n=1 Tax=Sporosarcina sp. JAI121 TaxID=2723064 RepID=UPI0015C900C7|nr:SurA N-terminal domain-containing protein [Sporosarcina sp. JAI121]NYF24389.1 FKBP-type peptidyl-prolyl cis-trans isomerase (trigger factor) [Sporosarcina sp. JAI121]
MNFKKILLPFIAGALAVSLAACSEEDKAAKDKTPQEETKQEASKQEAPKEEKESAEEMQAKLAEQQVDKNKVVAVVNDEELTGEDYNTALTSIQGQMQQMGQDPSSKEAAEQVKTQVLDTLVNQTLILQKAKEAKINASETEIDEEYSSFEKQFGGEKEMKKALKSQSMDVKTLKNQIAESIIFDKYLEKVAPAGKVSDKEIKAYYDKAAATSKEAGQELPPLEEVSQEIEGIINQEQQQKLLVAHVEELKAASKIELKL